MKHFRLTLLLLLFVGGILLCFCSCGEKDDGNACTCTHHDPDDPDNPNDPDPDDPDAYKMTVGELMYYGHDGEYSKDGGAIYFLYLKDANIIKDYSVCFYVNVPKQTTGNFVLPEGKYTAAETWEIGTFNTMDTEKYKSNWNEIAPKWMQYVVGSGEFEVTVKDKIYTIKGELTGGHIKDDWTIDRDEKSIKFTFTGKLPCTDYSDMYEDQPDPEPEPDPVTPKVTMTTGSLYRYDDNIYFLNLKDASPTDTYDATFYLKLPASQTPQLVSGEYTAAATSDEMTFDVAKSFWTFIDKANSNDRIKNKITEGTKLKVINNGNHNYTITAVLNGTSDKGDKQTSLEMSYSGTLPFEDYAKPDPVDPTVPEVNMTISDMYYNGGNEFYLNLKDAKSGTQTYDITFYFTAAPPTPLALPGGDYTASATGGEMTYNMNKSFWNYYDRSNGYTDTIKNKITEGTVKVVNNGNNSYTVSGTLKGTDIDGVDTAIKIDFSGTIPCEDYS